MKNKKNIILRNTALFALGAVSLSILQPGIAKIKTLLLIAGIESMALALSGIGAYVYTQIDFTRHSLNSNLGYIFLGVHICTGLVVLGVYIAQFSI